MISILVLDLAGVVAKAVFNVWASGSVGTGPLDSTVDLITTALQDTRDQRRAERQLSVLAENLADRLEPFLKSELNKLDDAEATSIVLAVQGYIADTALDTRLVLESDFDAVVFEQRLRSAHLASFSSLALSESGQALFDLLLTECCVFITAIAAQLPAFATANSREILRRESALLQLAEKTLDALPPSPVPKTWGHGDGSQRFETRYLRSVVEYGSQLELFGVASPTARRPYELSLAYISLSVAERGADDVTPNSNEMDGSPGSVSSRAEDFLDQHSNILLAGDAGSGKTTLLRWIATRAARTVGSRDVSGAWTKRVPFIIPLRRFVDADLPSPGAFVAMTAPNLAEVAPQGWAHAVLADQRALLLVDGLDEVPENRRGDVLKWVGQLLTDFPGNPVLVTSRGTAITTDWNSSPLFKQAELQPMEYGDIRAFIDHWHDAVAHVTTIDEQSEIRSANSSLINIVRVNQSIRALCTSPLLCALICALHLENGSSLPSDRMSLYKTALEMLVMKRDNDRKLGRSSVQLTQKDRELLLQRFAVWMHENGLADSGESEYVANVTRSLPQLHRVTAGAADVSQFLLERCGILREPAPARVDFIHRSFLEYLAAAALINEDSVPKLVLHATDDSWREVVILAAGHANTGQRRRLLEGLLDRGAADASIRHRLFLLAVACMQTAPELPVDLRQRLQEALSDVVPPTNMTDAAAVASAGETAASLLTAPGRKVMEAVACVRALSLIGGGEAYEAIKTYRKEKRLTVTRQLLRAWPSFDMRQYAEEVLRDSRFIRGTYSVPDPEQVEFLHLFSNLNKITLDFDGRLHSWEELQPLDGDGRVTALRAASSHWMVDLRGAPLLPALVQLDLSAASRLETLDGIDRFPALERLDLRNCVALSDITQISALPALKSLNLLASNLPSLEALSGRAAPIATATVYALPEMPGLGGQPLDVVDFTLAAYDRAIPLNVDALESSNTLETLSLWGGGLPPSLKLPTSLKELDVDHLTSPAVFEGAGDLKELTVRGEISVKTMQNLLSLGSLETVFVSPRSQSEEGVAALMNCLRVAGVRDVAMAGRYGLPPIEYAGYVAADERDYPHHYVLVDAST